MAYNVTDNIAGVQAIGSSSSAATCPLGRIVRAEDPVYGGGEFIYLLGVLGTVQGSLVTWSGVATVGGVVTPSYQTVLLPSTAIQGVPVAIAMAPNVAGQYGWYQLSGTAIAAATTFAAAGPAYIGTAGQAISTAAAGKQIVNAYGLGAVGTPAAGQVLLSINRPFAQGAIT